MQTFDETTRRRFLELAGVMATGVMISGMTGEAGATPPAGTMARERLALGRLNEHVTVATFQPSDFHVHKVVVQPGADSGWHTHPGTALDVVTAGALTVYMGGTDCEPRRIEAGQAVFVPKDVPHLARNEGAVPAEAYITYLVTAGAEPRTDAAAPGNCPS
jgi:quercetin dioxygenase-like cupin family protein